MSMISQETFGKLASGDGGAIDTASAAVSARNLSQPEIGAAWKGIISAILDGKGSRSALVSMGIKLADITQNAEARDMYEKLFMLAAFPATAQSYVAIIGTGASVAKILGGEAESAALDREYYVATAKKALMGALHESEGARKGANGDDGKIKMLEQNLVLVIEALRLCESPDVKCELVAIAKNGFGETVKKAAGDSIRPMRIRDEIEGVKADREFLLESVYQDPTTPQRMYIECIFTAIETVYSQTATENEVSIALKQVATFGTQPGVIAELFDSHSLKVITRNVENALLHAVSSKNPEHREAAANGLIKLGSDRVEGILERIVERTGEKNDVGALASEALAAIRGSKLEIMDVKPLPPPMRRTPPPPPMQKRTVQRC